MSENEKLVIPAGVQFDLSGDGVSIEYAGDILLQGEHIQPVGRVISTKGSVQIQGSMKVGQIESQRGSVSISGDITVGSITASDSVVLDGTIRFGSIKASGIEVIEGSIEGNLLEATENVELRGSTDVQNIRAPKITIRTGSLTAKALESTDSITIGNASIQVDIVIAPHVQVDPETTGRVAVIESENELGPNGIRGAFRLKEFAQFTGQNAELFLSERGVGNSLVLDDPFEEEAETTQVSVTINREPDIEPEIEAETEAPPALVEVYEPEPTPVSVEQEQPGPLGESSEEEDSEIPAWNAPPEQEVAEEKADDADNADNEIPAWNASPEPSEADEEKADDADNEIPAWNASLEPKEVKDDDNEIPAWNASLEPKDVAEEKAGDADNEIPAWNASLEPKERPPLQNVTNLHGGGAPEESSKRPEPIRVAVEMTEEPESTPRPKKPLPPIAAPKAPTPQNVSADEPISPIHRELMGTVNSLVTCYDGKEVPPAITELQSLVDAADFSKVRAEITNIWNNLLKHHQRTGTRLQHQVTTTFNTVNTLVRKID